MGNLGGMEVLVILLVALIVLGPTKLPDAAKQVGKAVNELRRISGGFQREMREALQDPSTEDKARERGRSLISEQNAARAANKNPQAKPDDKAPPEPSGEGAEPDESDEAAPTQPAESDEAAPTQPDDDESD